MPSWLSAGLIYFAIVFAAGFVLGAMRRFFLVPNLGELTSTMLELPVMLALAFFVSRIIMRPLQPASIGLAFLVGGSALLFLLVAEAMLSLWLIGHSLRQHLALYETMPVRIGLLGQIVFALFPLLNRRRNNPSGLFVA